MIPAPPLESKQIPLFHIIHANEAELLRNKDVDWFKSLYYLGWKNYRAVGAKYYDALYQFNLDAARKKEEALAASKSDEVETKEEARQRLLFNRDTMKKTLGMKRTILYPEMERVTPLPKTVEPMSIFPGKVPPRFGGKKPKCFFAMFKSFYGVSLMGDSPTPEEVHKRLQDNPSFVRACGFVPKGEKKAYYYRHMPSLRKIQQFDEIMTKEGLWSEIKWEEINRNISEGVIDIEEELVGDTTHYYAYSGFETVEYKDKKGKVQKKSQSKPTKRCRCKDREKCQHRWELADDGAGTVVKSKKRMYWAHKAGVIGFPRQGIPLDAVAINDAATHDGKTFFPHVVKIFQKLLKVKESIKRVLYDSACDDKKLKKKFKKEMGIELKASLNPGRKKEITKDLPMGIEKITPYGNPICRAGHEMDYLGMRIKEKRFIYRAPRGEYDIPVCLTCVHQKECCPRAITTGRTINISFDLLPQIDPQDPCMAKRFKAIMKRRPSVERMIKRTKCDMSGDHLTQRGNASFQAYLDKTMIAFHILLRQQQQEFKDST